MAKIRLVNLTKSYKGGSNAVSNVNLEIADREFVALVGPSGCGKSTTLRMIAGLEEITSGEVWIDDRLVNDVPAKDRNIAMVFQNYALYPYMTVFENMAFGLKLRGYPKSEIVKRVHEAADILGIKQYLERKPKELSGGERQRVALGRAIVRKPLVFLFDEPLSNLDAKMRVQMRTEIHKLRMRLQTTFIYVTHDQTEAMTMGDRIVVMRDGRIHQIDTPLTLYNNPVDQFVAGFIGSPAMNFIPGSLVKEGGLVFDEGHIRIPLPASFDQWLSQHAGREVILGIRPEDIHDPVTLGSGMNTVQITARVEVVEPMGSEVFLYLTTGKTSFVARVDPLHMPVVDQEVKLAVEIEKAHFFDKDSDASLVHRS